MLRHGNTGRWPRPRLSARAHTPRSSHRTAQPGLRDHIPSAIASHIRMCGRAAVSDAGLARHLGPGSTTWQACRLGMPRHCCGLQRPARRASPPRTGASVPCARCGHRRTQAPLRSSRPPPARPRGRRPTPPRAAHPPPPRPPPPARAATRPRPRAASAGALRAAAPPRAAHRPRSPPSRPRAAASPARVACPARV
eukprot:1485951-Prymnesium_polylepis.1